MMIEAVRFADHAVPAVVGIESNGKKARGRSTSVEFG
jgi:hypothetical protein